MCRAAEVMGKVKDAIVIRREVCLAGSWRGWTGVQGSNSELSFHRGFLDAYLRSSSCLLARIKKRINASKCDLFRSCLRCDAQRGQGYGQIKLRDVRAP